MTASGGQSDCSDRSKITNGCPTLINLAEDDHARKARFGVSWNSGVENIDSYEVLSLCIAIAIERKDCDEFWREVVFSMMMGIRTHCPLAICCGGDIVMRFFDEHSAGSSNTLFRKQ